MIQRDFRDFEKITQQLKGSNLKVGNFFNRDTQILVPEYIQ